MSEQPEWLAFDAAVELIPWGVYTVLRLLEPLRPADPDHVPLADDVQAALAAAGRLDAFRRRTPAQQ